jgi:hypothetical protein
LRALHRPLPVKQSGFGAWPATVRAGTSAKASSAITMTYARRNETGGEESRKVRPVKVAAANHCAPVPRPSR